MVLTPQHGTLTAPPNVCPDEFFPVLPRATLGSKF
jgi:hypothetical protein